MWRLLIGWPLRVLATALVAAALLWLTEPYWQQRAAVLPLAGGDSGSLATASAEQERIAPQAMAQLIEEARKLGAHEVLVARNGHLLRESLHDPAAGASLVAGGDIGAVLLALAPADAPDAAALPERVARADRQVWQVLNAAPARWRPNRHWPRACCLEARSVDLLRLAMVIAADGRFDGAAVLLPETVQQIRAPVRAGELQRLGWLLAGNARGAEPFVSREVLFQRGPGATRLWAVPAQGLAMLLVAPQARAADFDETALPNIVLRGMHDRVPAPRAASAGAAAAPAAVLAPSH